MNETTKPAVTPSDPAAGSALLPCPFCGGKARGDDFAVHCLRCGAPGPDFNWDPLNAIHRWNERRYQRTIASAIPPLPEGMSREQAVLALRDLRDLATAAEAKADPGFKRWPTLDALIDHVAVFGLPPTTKRSGGGQ